MPNFAQEFPLLLFMPILILAVVAVTAVIIHFVSAFEAKIRSPRATASAAIRRSFAAAVSALPQTLDRRVSSRAAGAYLRPIFRKV